MNKSAAIGEVVFLRTDTPDFSEETQGFNNLDELVWLCSHIPPGQSLQRVMIYSENAGRGFSLVLGLISCCVENAQAA